MPDWLRWAILGLLGGAIPEVIRFIAALRADKMPSKRQAAASALSAFLGLGVLFFNNSASSHLQVAVLGASFPQLFSALVAATTSGGEEVTRGTTQRQITDYLSWRFR
jgi:hypothetical protein